jgi:hypothetical protein
MVLIFIIDWKVFIINWKKNTPSFLKQSLLKASAILIVDFSNTTFKNNLEKFKNKLEECFLFRNKLEKIQK